MGYENVHIEKRFLTQQQIADLHKEYGIFLVPTRMDSQGVSRDEAMASGLVPITNNVAAIPEFVDESCGILAPPEDYIAMADGIERLYNSPELFLKMSENAAERVRKQSSEENTIKREIFIIESKSSRL
jgi:glycosyltransferase involved in cell wall biosynthesis